MQYVPFGERCGTLSDLGIDLYFAPNEEETFRTEADGFAHPHGARGDAVKYDTARDRETRRWRVCVCADGATAASEDLKADAERLLEEGTFCDVLEGRCSSSHVHWRDWLSSASGPR